MIGNNINFLRKKKGITLTDLAVKANIAKSNLSNIERNINDNPSIKVLIKIANVLDVELNTILGIKLESCKYEESDDLTCFVERLKKQGVTKIQILEYQKVIEFIEWQMNREGH